MEQQLKQVIVIWCYIGQVKSQMQILQIEYFIPCLVYKQQRF